VIATNGGFAEDNKFVKLGFISYDLLHKTWQYNLFMELKNIFQRGLPIAVLINILEVLLAI
jgi:hypothetical protein